MTTHTLFSDKSDLYQAARPLYPKELFEYLSNIAPNHQLAWDCACGNGQAAASLAKYFEQVKATDVSKEQIANAKQQANIEYSVSSAEATVFAAHSFDLVCVAQALHWFDYDKFWPEVKRVLKPNGIFATWGYTWPSIDADIDARFEQSILKVIEPYWAKQNQLLWDHYQGVDIPMTLLPAPALSMKVHWNLEQFIQFVSTFSATRRCIDDIGDDFLERAYQQIAEVWGPVDTRREVDLEFVLRVARYEP